MTPTVAERAARLLGASLARASPIAGGDLSEVVAIELDDGRSAIVKGGPSPVTEAGMLDAIRATGAPAPAVLACDDTVLVLERLAGGGRIGDAWSDLGTVLARLHSVTGDTGARARYGWHVDYAFGSVPIENTWTDSWPGFWGERRLANQLPQLPAALATRIEALAAGLGDRLPSQPPPALLHGDLWGGNVLVHRQRISGLIDPACYHGDCEVDFAMLCLFGHPDDALLAAYGALPPGAEARVPIYQLWPALVHLRLFGAGYRPLVERLLAAVGV